MLHNLSVSSAVTLSGLCLPPSRISFPHQWTSNAIARKLLAGFHDLLPQPLFKNSYNADLGNDFFHMYLKTT
jgi:hypothetical protein